MLKILFKENDEMMKFYEGKYRFEMKDIRPFAHAHDAKELNPLHNDEVFEREIGKIQEAQRKERKVKIKRFREMEKDKFTNTNYMKP